MLTRRYVFALYLLCSGAYAATPGLSPGEQRIVAAATAEDAQAISFLESLVNINSGTMNFAGVEHVGQIMSAQLQGLGFATRWHSMNAVGRAGHVIAEHHGTGHGKRILLVGHLDTVFEKDSPFQRYQRRGDTAEGPGVCDMKGGLAVMVSALRALKSAGALKDVNVSIVLDGDEENAGLPLSVSRADLIEAGKNADVALEFEPLASEDGHDMGSVSRRGDLDWTLRTSAKSGHSSEIFSDPAGFGASYELTRILDAFRRELREPNATYNVGLVLSGSSVALNDEVTGGSASGKGNVISAQGLARGDLRTLSNDQTARLEARMRAIVSEHLPGTNAEIQFDEGYPAMAPTPGNRALLARINEINTALGLEQMAELDPLKRGAGDISFVADKVDGLVGFGVAGHGLHAPGETADLSSIDRQIKRAALLMERLSQVH
jgi:glutamate carboxypeptidase